MDMKFDHGAAKGNAPSKSFLEAKKNAQVKAKGEKVAKTFKGVGDKLKLTVSTNPATEMAGVYTTVTNITSNTLVFGFLPPHGKSLTAGESVVIPGDLKAQLLTGGGRVHKRKYDALEAAIDAKLIRLSVDRQ
jgi:hypothetical protein